MRVGAFGPVIPHPPGSGWWRRWWARMRGPALYAWDGEAQTYRVICADPPPTPQPRREFLA